MKMLETAELFNCSMGFGNLDYPPLTNRNPQNRLNNQTIQLVLLSGQVGTRRTCSSKTRKRNYPKLHHGGGEVVQAPMNSVTKLAALHSKAKTADNALWFLQTAFAQSSPICMIPGRWTRSGLLKGCVSTNQFTIEKDPLHKTALYQKGASLYKRALVCKMELLVKDSNSLYKRILLHKTSLIGRRSCE
eukprot:3297154-Amphidinium_carterae.1